MECLLIGWIFNWVISIPKFRPEDNCKKRESSLKKYIYFMPILIKLPKEEKKKLLVLSIHNGVMLYK